MVKLDYASSQTHHLSEITKCGDGCLEAETLVPIRDAEPERKHGFVSLAECLSIERALETSIPERKALTPATCASVDSTPSVENSVDQYLVTESKVVKTSSYKDKAMTEIERPKMIVCFEKEAYELVKDICVDSGVQSFDKVSSPPKDKVDDPKIDPVYREAEWTDVNVVPGFNNLNTFLLNEHSISDVHHGVSKQQLQETENHNDDEIVSQSASLFSVGKTKDQCGDEVCFSTIDSTAEGLPRLVDAKAPTLQCSEYVNHQESSKQDSSKEENARESSVCSDDEPGTSGNLRDVDKSRDPISEMDSGNVKERGNEAPGAENEAEATMISPQHGPSKDANRETSNGLSAEARSSLVHYGFADDSLFGQHSMPNSISFSGQVAYNGSTSLRSDSSTTSTRSFAFPILQSEWNSSPVKMAKPDRKYYRRHRWRNGFLCCRF